MDSGYIKQIRERILNAEAGTVFASSDFADIADMPTIRKSLQRLTLWHAVIIGQLYRVAIQH